MEYGVKSYTTILSLSEYEEQLKMSYGKLFLKSTVESGDHVLIVNSTSLANIYYDYIQRSVVNLSLTDRELMKYRYQPKMFCSDMYGTTELWGLLLKINNLTSVVEFNHKMIKVFNSDIFDILNEILINEEHRIMENNEDVGV